MIDPTSITKFNRTETELQEYFLFCICVMGKSAVVQAKRLNDFLKPSKIGCITPFEYIKELRDKEHLGPMLSHAKLGQYKRLEHIFMECIDLNLKKVTLEELEQIPGIGPNTSRLFTLHSRSKQRIVLLEPYILAWLSKQHPNLTVPKAIPQSTSRYKEFETLYLGEAKKRKMKPAKLGLQILKEQARITA